MTDEEMAKLGIDMVEYLMEREFGRGWPMWPGDDPSRFASLAHMRVSQGWRVYGQLVALSEGRYRG